MRGVRGRLSPLSVMSGIFAKAVGLALTTASALAPAFPARADEAATMSFYFKNQSGRDLAAELYSGDRRARWPGGDHVWLLERGQNKAIPVECRPGERLCWGAWANGNDRVGYGVGIDNRYACEECCTICVGSEVEEVVIDAPNER